MTLIGIEPRLAGFQNTLTKWPQVQNFWCTWITLHHSCNYDNRLPVSTWQFNSSERALTTLSNTAIKSSFLWGPSTSFFGLKFYSCSLVMRFVNFTIQTPTSSLPDGKNFKVGNPLISKDSTSLAVASIFAIIMSSLSLKCSPSLSQVGWRDLQCPHHGASRVRIIIMSH